MSLVTGWIFYQLDGSLSGVRSREAALYVGISMHGYLILLFETYRLCEVDIRIFDREHGEGVVGVFAYLISRRLAKLVSEDILVPVVFSVSVSVLVLASAHRSRLRSCSILCADLTEMPANFSSSFPSLC